MWIVHSFNKHFFQIICAKKFHWLVITDSWAMFTTPTSVCVDRPFPVNVILRTRYKVLQRQATKLLSTESDSHNLLHFDQNMVQNN